MTPPATPTKTARGDVELLRRVWPFIRPWRGWLWASILLTPIGVGAGLVQPILLKSAIDDHIAPGNLEGLGTLAALFVLVVALAFGAQSFSGYALQHAGLEALAALRRRVFDHVLSQGQRFFDRRTTGSLMTRTTTDVEAVYESLAFGVVNLLSDGLMILGILVAMLALDWRLALVSLSFSPLIVLVVDLFRRKLRDLSLVIRSSLSALNGFFAERIHGMTTVQLHGAEETTRRRFADLSFTYLDANRRANWWDAGLYAIMDGLGAMAVGLLLWYGAGRYGEPVSQASSVVTLGLLVAFVDYLGMIFGPIREFSGRIATLQRAVAALERIFDLLDQDDRVREGTIPLARARGEIVLRDVRFRYAPDRPLVLDGVDLHLRPGEVVALVGATGSGKSTIGKLLTRMYDGYEGSITLDGHELRDVRPDDVRRNLAVVHQDVTLFDASVRDNVALWSPDLDDARVLDAARHARADVFVSRLPGAFDHRIAERGSNLSGGQKQLLAIARVLARDAPVVVLDEATASVDSVTEHLVDEAVAELLRSRTVLVIAHRLSTVRKADRVLLLHHGKVVEEGTHAELIARGGRYKTLVEVGFAL